jgi:hypothetical protein
MPFDTPEQALLFDIKFAVISFKQAPPPKSHRAATSDWKERLAKHIFAHLQRAQWDLQQKPGKDISFSALMPKKDG